MSGASTAAGGWSLAAAAFLVTGLNELGDKSQVAGILLAGATRRPWPVLAGMVTAFTLLDGLAVVAGDWVGASLPPRLTMFAGGALFAGLGAAALFWAEEAEGGARRWLEKAGSWSPYVLALAAIGAAEMGDRTQLAAAGLAAESGRPWPVFLGTVSSLTLSSALTVSVGRWLGERAPLAALHKAGGACFLVLGLLLLYRGLFLPLP